MQALRRKWHRPVSLSSSFHARPARVTVAGMNPVKAICPTCDGSRVRRQLRAAVSMRVPWVLGTMATEETCDTCQGRGAYPMPGVLIEGPMPALA